MSESHGYESSRGIVNTEDEVKDRPEETCTSDVWRIRVDRIPMKDEKRGSSSR